MGGHAIRGLSLQDRPPRKSSCVGNKPAAPEVCVVQAGLQVCHCDPLLLWFRITIAQSPASLRETCLCRSGPALPIDTGVSCVFQSIPALAKEGPSGRKKLPAYRHVRPKVISQLDPESVLQPLPWVTVLAPHCPLQSVLCGGHHSPTTQPPQESCPLLVICVIGAPWQWIVVSHLPRGHPCALCRVAPAPPRLVFIAGCLWRLLLAGEWWVLPSLGCFTLVPASLLWPQRALPLFSQHNQSPCRGRLFASSFKDLAAQSF